MISSIIFRILLNRETARRTHDRREQHILALEKMVHTLGKEAATATAHISSVGVRHTLILATNQLTNHTVLSCKICFC